MTSISPGSILSWLPSASIPFPDSKVHGGNMGPTWDGQDPGGPHRNKPNITYLLPLKQPW